MSTDGQDLFSYSLKIGYTDPEKAANKTVIDYTGKNMWSVTTSCHVGLAKRVADQVVQPSELKAELGGQMDRLDTDFVEVLQSIGFNVVVFD